MGKRLLLIILGVLLLSFTYSVSEANANEGMGEVFSVRPVLDSNQDKEVDNYFSFSIKGKEFNKELGFVVANLTDKPIELDVFGLNAMSSPSGEIQYLKETEVENAKVLDTKYEFSKYLKAPEKIKLGPKESKTVKANVAVEGLDGTLLGSVGFQLVTEKQDLKDQQFGIISEYRTVIGVLIKFEDKHVENFSVGKTIIHPMSDRFTMKLPIQLNSANLLKNSELTYEVMNSDREKLFGISSPIKINFAPTSEAKFFLPWDLDKISKNKEYILSGDIHYINERGERDVFHFENKIKYLEGEYLEDINKERGIMTKVVDDYFWYLVIGGILIGLLLLFLLYKLLKKKELYMLHSNESHYKLNIYMNEPEIEYLVSTKGSKPKKTYPFVYYYKPIYENKEIVKLEYVKKIVNK